MAKWYYLITPKYNEVVAKSELLSWARLKRDEYKSRGSYVKIYEVAHTATGTTMTPVK